MRRIIVAGQFNLQVCGKLLKCLQSLEKRALVDDGFVMDELNGNGKRGLPKLREILRRQKQDSEVGHDIS